MRRVYLSLVSEAYLQCQCIRHTLPARALLGNRTWSPLGCLVSDNVSVVSACHLPVIHEDGAGHAVVHSVHRADGLATSRLQWLSDEGALSVEERVYNHLHSPATRSRSVFALLTNALSRRTMFDTHAARIACISQLVGVGTLRCARKCRRFESAGVYTVQNLHVHVLRTGFLHFYGPVRSICPTDNATN